MHFSRLVRLVLLAAAAGTAFVARAAVELASPFTSHMVLQREQPVPVWGTAAPGEKVTVQFDRQQMTTTADDQGQWRVQLAPLAASSEPRVLSVRGAGADEVIELSDVLVGEVWLCSGQSNMDFTVAKTEKYGFAGVANEAEEVARADHPQLRMFTGEWTRAYVPQARVPGTWKVCTPENVREFSAVGYFFARDLQQALGVPVGIVTLTYGASTAQAWIRRKAIAADPRLKPVLDDFDAKVKAYAPPSAQEQQVWDKAVAKAKEEKKRPPRRPRPHPVQDQHNPTVMFNGMVAPFVGFSIRGVLWYQGESITAPRELFPLWNETLIKDWRTLWGRELPFFFCQLAGQNAASNGPDVRAWQAEALKLPNTAMAVTIDIGEERNVHPRNKQDVGARLCRIALARTYGRPIEYSGPQLEKMVGLGGALRLTFSHTTGGLTDRGAPLRSFEVAGDDGKFMPATATIDGDTVYVSSSAVATPVSVRYAWAPFPAGCNLYNGEGLPAAPFQASLPR
ncbi:sialate O-acetylesterase [Opitutus sp. ER46]|uniref:sialate O-acetylesterase n=1 Tax=Opitutus sp. ER46 TaxID=2161864 RepID=UPI001304D981|nr:sialate O-acetylesterase [Opitutus sp. ER46]